MDIEELKQIRVTIKDGDALGKLSWERVRDYLLKNGWKKIHDVKFGSKWQYPEKNGRYYQTERAKLLLMGVINLPETRDIEDYNLRMHDILQELEYATGKSQLELYEMLMDGDF